MTGATALLVAGCGGGTNKPQDRDEPRGDFPISVTEASFPDRWRLAKTADMVIGVRNAGTKTIPNVNVTTKCKAGVGGSFAVTSQYNELAERQRPQFVVNRIPTRTSPDRERPLQLDPLERSSSLVDTYSLGPLAAGDTIRFRWNVTAVKPGPYRVCWRVNAGLWGKARATSSDGVPINGAFEGEINREAPRSRLANDDRTVVTEE